MSPPLKPLVVSGDTNHSDKQIKWDNRFLELCELLASWSEDPSRKVGAVIVGSAHTILSTGYNGLPRGISHLDESRLSREEGKKYHWIEHAERNAIYNAVRNGVTLDGATMYASLFPCSDCARGIIQSGISTLVTRGIPKNEIRFAQSMATSIEMFQEAKVHLRLYE
ncbi:deoxycytidylate deaminase [Shimia sp. Alg240-R146]|uniref:deoxycytidylate deaminase n=1 Tax=Shimia sp. Alg240-R146 TaxID=2993449 RepID=UPI0022E30045|nr:dCMP deaminase family protein [Shimia sp. Alg240-R146]